MDKFIIKGGNELNGTISVNGSKNSALPIMAATLMAEDVCTIRMVPDLADLRHLCDLLVELGMAVKTTPHSSDDIGGELVMSVKDEKPIHARYDLVRKMRASICVLGPLLAKRGRARVAMPGGCAIGSRPVDLHIRGLRALGAKIELDGGDIVASADKLIGAEIFLGGPFGSTVLGTANVMMAATLARGKTTIESAACEPEIEDLANFLNAMGAKVSGGGTPKVIIEGVEKLTGCEHELIPDRIEAGTFMMATAATGGDAQISNVRLEHLLAAVDKLREIGITVERSGTGVSVSRKPGRFCAVDATTQPYPGFPTDLQAQLTAILSLADGNSIVTDKIFPDRFLHVAELLRMGANIRKEGATAIIAGAEKLIAAPVMASDLRASAALVIAGLIADGTTTISRVYHIDRGYEKIEQRLKKLGADIERAKE